MLYVGGAEVGKARRELVEQHGRPVHASTPDDGGRRGARPSKERERAVRRGVAVALLLLGLAAGVFFIALPGPEPVRASHPEGVIYVDRDAVGANDGSTWANAFTNLQAALEHATSGDEIWVAEGVYTPTFQLENGVAIYGGFAATETMRAERDWVANVTVLSGDLGGDDRTDANGVVTDSTSIVGANSPHVVTSEGTDGTAVLDGVTVTAGQALEPGEEYGEGGGLTNNAGSPTLTNVIFSGNWAEYGGGMASDGGSPMLTNVTFSGNAAEDVGGAMFVDGANLTLTNAGRFGNNAPSLGAGIAQYSGTMTLTNSIFSGNWSGLGGGIATTGVTTLIHVTVFANTGGGLLDESSTGTTVRNSVFWQNHGGEIVTTVVDPTVEYSLVEFGYPGTGNINADPRFVDVAGADDEIGTVDDDLRLQPGSPAIDAAPCEISTDMDGNPRPGVGSSFCDMGAYETQGVSADLAISKSARRVTARPGESVTYTLVYSNVGSARADGVVITDIVPIAVTGASYSSSGATITPTGSSQWIWQVADLAPGAGGTITITGTLDPSVANGTIIDNEASINAQGEDASPDDNRSAASVVVMAGGNKLYLPLLVRQPQAVPADSATRGP
ncbi:MAG TPA: choice-of-anchor Q domain-containing protein [Ardenticatenaceae bacterium]|nr:choice-of-anchor Q domain-containing protein [Ardenticatenaceae bacterium]